MADALAALDKLNSHLATLAQLAHSGRARTLAIADAQPVARLIATTYFESMRPALDAVKSRPPLVDEIDFVIQSILQLASSVSEKQAYVGQLNELRPYLLEATIDLMKSRGVESLVLSQTERAILDTLIALKLSCAGSYEQSLRDIAQGNRVSWRGTATELRETLREIIDHLAPDAAVSGAPGFQLEAGQRQPTQKQKVRYILKARRANSSVVSVAEGSLAIVDEAVAALARTTYNRGSVSTHIGSTGKEIRNLKRYVDALLGELLELGQ